MPIKVRQLKAQLAKAGFLWRPGKGSHMVWSHPALPDVAVTLSGKDVADAQGYQIRQVRNALKHLERS